MGRAVHPHRDQSWNDPPRTVPGNAGSQRPRRLRRGLCRESDRHCDCGKKRRRPAGWDIGRARGVDQRPQVSSASRLREPAQGPLERAIDRSDGKADPGGDHQILPLNQPQRGRCVLPGAGNRQWHDPNRCRGRESWENNREERGEKMVFQRAHPGRPASEVRRSHHPDQAGRGHQLAEPELL